MISPRGGFTTFRSSRGHMILLKLKKKEHEHEVESLFVQIRKERDFGGNLFIQALSARSLVLLSVSQGVFEPPVNGVYVLTVYALTESIENGPMFLRNNDDVLCQTWLPQDQDVLGTGTCTAVVELVVGDSVRVTGSSDIPAIISGGYSGFAGFIIN